MAVAVRDRLNMLPKGSVANGGAGDFATLEILAKDAMVEW